MSFFNVNGRVQLVDGISCVQNREYHLDEVGKSLVGYECCSPPAVYEPS